MNMAGAERINDQNVYIASLPRSGSTLLGMILNQNNDCFYIGESFYWNKLNPNDVMCTCGLKGCIFLNNVYNKVKFDLNILKISEVIVKIDTILQSENVDKSNKIEDDFSKNIIQCCVGFNNLADLYRKEAQKRIIVDSSSNIVIARELTVNNKWKAIILTRDPRGIISSFKKAAHRYQKAISKDLWGGYLIDFAERAIILASQENSLIIRYEDLCNNTNNALKNISTFLKIKFDPPMVRYRQNKGHILMANRMRFDEGEDIKEDVSWQSFLTEGELNIIYNNRELIAAYNKLGYAL